MTVRPLKRDPLVEEALFFARGIAASRPAEAELAPAELLLTKRPDSAFMISERAEFRRRVIEFRARQHSIRQGRERYCDEAWSKIRSALDI